MDGRTPGTGTAGSSASALDHYVPYLLNHVGGRIAMGVARDIRAHGISFTMWRVLHTLWHTGPLKLVQLAAKANFDLSTLSRVVSELETRGLLARGAGRGVSASLTPAGAALVETLLPLAHESEEKALSVLSPGERAILVELLHKLDRAVRGHPRRLR
jgi:DNA-binding MarR family transcriptional regulator